MKGARALHARILVCLLLSALFTVAAVAQTTHKHPQPVKVTKGAAKPAAKPAAAKAPTAKPATPAAKPVATPAKPLAPVTPPLALVNGSPIAQSHVDRAIANRWAGPIMKAMIDDRLIRQEARKLGLKAAPEEVAAKFKTVREKYSTEAAFQRHLLAQGLTGQGLTEKLTTEILLDKLLARESAVSADDVKRYYADHKAEYTSPAEIHLYTITTGTIEDAYLVRERLASGEKYESVARELSLDAAKQQGGDNAWVRAASLPERPYADALFAMEIGVVSSPLRLGGKYVVALVKERKPEQTVSFEQAQKEITAKLQAEKTVKAEDYLRILERKGNIVVNWAPARFLTAEFARLKEIQVIVDDEPLDLTEVPVRLPNGTIIVPAKPILQAIGAKLEWKAADQTLTATSVAGKIKLVVGSPRAIVGTTTLQATDMKEAPTMRNGVLFIAPRVALQALGADLNWNAVENALVVDTVAKDMPSPTVPKVRSGLEKQP